MIGFKGKTVLERIDSEFYMVRNNLTWETENYKITVKKGFKTNGASIPNIFYSLIGCPFVGKYVGAAIIHDALYGCKPISKQKADLIFNDIMIHNEVPVWKRYMIYQAVKQFGQKAWNEANDDKGLIIYQEK